MLMLGAENFLDATIYAAAAKDYPPPFAWSDFSSVVLQISDFYSANYPEQVKTAQEWNKEMFDAGRDQSHSTWEHSSRKGARLRFNLIVTAEKLSGREKLSSARVRRVKSRPQGSGTENPLIAEPFQWNRFASTECGSHRTATVLYRTHKAIY